MAKPKLSAREGRKHWLSVVGRQPRHVGAAVRVRNAADLAVLSSSRSKVSCFSFRPPVRRAYRKDHCVSIKLAAKKSMPATGYWRKTCSVAALLYSCFWLAKIRKMWYRWAMKLILKNHTIERCEFHMLYGCFRWVLPDHTGALLYWKGIYWRLTETVKWNKKTGKCGKQL